MNDPKKVGPGVWYTLHLKAKLATEQSSKDDFVKEIYFHYHNFPCLNCRTHIQEYVDSHSLKPFMTLIDENGVDVGLFKWTWFFHNTVNKRLGKLYMDWETAYELYNLGDGQIKPCTDCGSSGDKVGGKDGKNNGSKVDKKSIVEGYFRQKRY